MTNKSNTTTPAEPKPPRFGIGNLLFIIVLALIAFLLVQSMARHRFHEGGRRNRNGSIGP
jgi:hypothetical protein